MTTLSCPSQLLCAEIGRFCTWEPVAPRPYEGRHRLERFVTKEGNESLLSVFQAGAVNLAGSSARRYFTKQPRIKGRNLAKPLLSCCHTRLMLLRLCPKATTTRWTSWRTSTSRSVKVVNQAMKTQVNTQGEGRNAVGTVPGQDVMGNT